MTFEKKIIEWLYHFFPQIDQAEDYGIVSAQFLSNPLPHTQTKCLVNVWRMCHFMTYYIVVGWLLGNDKILFNWKRMASR